MQSIFALCTLLSVACSVPLTGNQVRQAPNGIIELPIKLDSTSPASVAATAVYSDNTELVHLNSINVPGFQVTHDMLIKGFPLDIATNMGGLSIKMPVTLRRLGDANAFTKHEGAMRIRSFVLPGFDIKIEGLTEAIAVAADSTIGSMSIRTPAVPSIAKRQFNFWDEVIDIGLQIGDIIIIINRRSEIPSAEKRQPVVIRGLKVDVSLAGDALSARISN